MRNYARRGVARALMAVILSALLAGVPAISAAQKNLGFVAWANKAQLDGITAVSGANVFVGDVLATSADGSLRIQVSSNQFLLPGSSAIRLSEEGAGVRAALVSGMLMFTAATAAKISVSALDILIQPQASVPTAAEIGIVAPDELRIVAEYGPLQLQLDGESYTLTPGHAWGVRIIPAAEKDTNRRTARKRRGLLIFLLGIGAIAGITYMIRELHESPDVP